MPKNTPERIIDNGYSRNGAGSVTVRGGNTTIVTSPPHTHSEYTPLSTYEAHADEEDAHQDRLHDVFDVLDHYGTGSQYQLAGFTATDTWGKLTPASDISGGNTIAISDANGDVTVRALTADRTDGISLTANTLKYDGQYGALWINEVGDPTTNGGAVRVVSNQANQIGMYIRARSDQDADLIDVTNSSNTTLWHVLSDGNIQNATYSADKYGWRLDPAGRFEAWNANIRGTIHATLFQIDEALVTSGRHIVSPSGGVVLEDVACAGVGNTIVFKIEDRPGTSAAAFRVGDVLYLFALGVEPSTGTSISRNAWDVDASANEGTLITAEAWFTVTSRAYSTDHWEYTCDIEYGAAFTVREGTAIVNFGQIVDDPLDIGDDLYPGHVEITAISGANYGDGDPQPGSPKITVSTMQSETPWGGTPFVDHVLIGEISGINTALGSWTSGNKSNAWGIAFSEGFDDDQNPHAVLSSQESMFYKIPFVSATGDGAGGVRRTVEIKSNGSVTFSTDLDDLSTGGFRFFGVDTTLSLPGKSSSYEAGDVVVGDPFNQQMKWDQSLGELQIISGPVRTDAANPTTLAAGLYLSKSSMGYWDGNNWRSRMTSGGDFEFIHSPDDENSEDYVAGSGLFWDATNGRLSGKGERSGTSGVATQWYADASTGQMVAGGGHVTLDEDGITLLESSSATSWQEKEAISFGDDMSILGWAVSNDKVLRIASTPGYATTNSDDADVRLIAAGGTASSPNEAEIRVSSLNNGNPSNFYINTDQIEVSMVLPTSAGSSSGKYLPIVRGGVTYHIALLDES